VDHAHGQHQTNYDEQHGSLDNDQADSSSLFAGKTLVHLQ
jgi:hypothetical protein